jgi:iron complex transport system substrate-binding protein
VLTSVNYIDDPIGEIKSRPGWENITAIQNDDVYYIDTDASNRPSHHIVKALRMMAKAVYPDRY